MVTRLRSNCTVVYAVTVAQDRFLLIQSHTKDGLCFAEPRSRHTEHPRHRRQVRDVPAAIQLRALARHGSGSIP